MKKRFLRNSAVGLSVVVVLTGLAVWWMDTTPHPSGDKVVGSVTASVPQIPLLGVEFTPKPGATPIGSVVDKNANGVSYHVVALTTQELVNKGAAVAFDPIDNFCEFSPGVDDGRTSGYAPLKVSVYASASDLLKAESLVKLADMTAANGYITVGGKVFHVPAAPQLAPPQQGCLLDTGFENQQISLLHEAFMTLHAVE
jgi:hypothetical protein